MVYCLNMLLWSHQINFLSAVGYNTLVSVNKLQAAQQGVFSLVWLALRGDILSKIIFSFRWFYDRYATKNETGRGEAGKAWPMEGNERSCFWACYLYANSAPVRGLPPSHNTEKASNNHRLEKCVRCVLLLYNWYLRVLFGWLPMTDMVITSYFWNSQ